MMKKVINRSKKIAESVLAFALLIMMTSIVCMIPQVATVVAEMFKTTKEIVQATAFNILLVTVGVVMIVISPIFIFPIFTYTVLVAGIILVGIGSIRLWSTWKKDPTDTGIFPDSLRFEKKK